MENIENLEAPSVNKREWISVKSNGPRPIDAVVCWVNDADKNEVEAVYFQGIKAINEYFVWRNGRWEFKTDKLGGGYADKSTRLSEYVAILRRGRHR